MDFWGFLQTTLQFAKENQQLIGTIIAVLLGGPFVLKMLKLILEHYDKQREEDRVARVLLEAELASTKERHATAVGCVNQLTTDLDSAKRTIHGIKAAFAKGDLWLREPIVWPESYEKRIRSSIPIILCANLKGGVGKTTIAANLASYFEKEHGERVLALDLDYQGSLSSMLLDREARRTKASADAAMTLLSGNATGQWLNANSLPIAGSKRDSRVIECFYEFANFETKLTIDWLVNEPPHDMRYNLARVLLSDDVQHKYHRVIIDSPPRVTAGLINALCTSTHLLIPTVLDVLSAEAVGTFLRYVRTMKTRLYPELELAGVVGSLKRFNTDKMMPSEKEALALLDRVIPKEWQHGQFVIEQGFIPRVEAIAEAAGQKIIYHQHPEYFRNLGKVVYERTRRQGAHHAHRLPNLSLPPPIAIAETGT